MPFHDHSFPSLVMPLLRAHDSAPCLKIVTVVDTETNGIFYKPDGCSLPSAARDITDQWPSGF